MEYCLKYFTHCVIAKLKIIRRSFVPKLLEEYTKGYSIGLLFLSNSALLKSKVGKESSVLLNRKIWHLKAVSESNKILPNASDRSANTGQIVRR